MENSVAEISPSDSSANSDLFGSWSGSLKLEIIGDKQIKGVCNRGVV